MTPGFFSSPVVVCRPALPCDTANVREFTKYIWDGHDYVQYAWNGWLADPRGFLAAAEFAGRCVGCAKATLLAPGQWWLEGFRVDPRYQGQKVGSHIHDYITEWWLEHGDGTIRLMTSSQRVQVHHLCEKLGYHKIGEVAGFQAAPITGGDPPFQPLLQSDLPTAFQFIQASPSLRSNNGLVDLGWQFVTPNQTSLAKLAGEGLAWWWREREGLLLAWEDKGETEEDDRLLAIGLPACRLEGLPELLLDVRRLAARKGYAHVFWIVSTTEPLTTTIKQAGFERKWENNGYIYEKGHPTRP